VVADYFNDKRFPKYMFLPVETISRDNVSKWEAACTF
jgi:hypothetical protein